MKIIYFSSGIRGTICLRALLEKNYDIAAVICSYDDTELKILSIKYDFKLIKNTRPNTVEFADELKYFCADIFILCGYNKILKRIVFSIPLLGTLNLHGGRLPQYRGAAPINWQIINDEKKGACCIIFVDDGIDTGPILCQEYYSIDPNDTHASILNKTLEIFPRILIDTLKKYEAGSVEGTPQDPREGCYYTRRYPEDSKINWDLMSDGQVHNLVRAMHGPYPSAYTFFLKRKIEIELTQILQEEIHGISGRISLKYKNGVIVICKNRGLLVKQIKVDNELIEPQKYFKIGDVFR